MALTPKEQSDRKGKLQYPIENSGDYKGRIRFGIIEEPQADLSKIVSETKNDGKKALETITNSGGNNATNGEQKKSIMQQFNGTINEAFKPKTPGPVKREVSLYLPVGLQFRDNVGYENADLLSGNIASGVAAAQLLSGSGGTNEAKLALLSLSQKNQGAATLARVGGRVTSNPNTRALFKNVNLREFAFTFKFVPKSRKEAEEVKQIIQMFREELYPESIPANVAGTEISIGYKFPNRFQIEIEYDGQRIANKILPCYLRDVSTSYNPTTMAMHEDGNFSEIDLSLSFTESRTLDKKDIAEGGF